MRPYQLRLATSSQSLPHTTLSNLKSQLASFHSSLVFRSFRSSGFHLRHHPAYSSNTAASVYNAWFHLYPSLWFLSQKSNTFVLFHHPCFISSVRPGFSSSKDAHLYIQALHYLSPPVEQRNSHIPHVHYQTTRGGVDYQQVETKAKILVLSANPDLNGEHPSTHPALRSSKPNVSPIQASQTLRHALSFSNHRRFLCSWPL